MMKRLICVLWIFIMMAPLSCRAQKDNPPSSSKKAIKLFQEAREKYEYRKSEDAARILNEVIKEDSNFFEARMLLANVSDDLGNFIDAIRHYKAAIQLQPDRFPPNYFNLAGSEISVGAYADAAVHLEKFLGYPTINPQTRQKAERRLANARYAVEAIKHPVNFNPENLGSEINSELDEYHPALTADENQIIYTRRRPADGLSDVGGSSFEEDFYASNRSDGKWMKSTPLATPVNSNRNEGAHSISPDGSVLYFTGCGRPEGMGSCDLYVSVKTGNKWSAPVNLSILNSPDWDTQPTISPDGKELIFVSKRAGGYGGGDLWRSVKNEKGNWTTPVNLGNILNTLYEESGPFLHPDGTTLFFASAGHPGMGGQDLYYSKRNSDGSWGIPVNLGYPINTGSEEEHLVVNAEGDKAYFSSGRPGGKGGKDIYMFELPESLRPRPVTYLSGTITDRVSGKPVSASINIIDLSDGKTKAISISDKVSGQYMVCLPSGGSYALNVSSAGYLFYSGNYNLEHRLKPDGQFRADISLSPVQAGSSMILRNIFFKSGSWELLAESETELRELNDFLMLNKDLRIEIGGHTDNQGNDQDNLNLSLKRAEAVVNYLKSKGVEGVRLQAKGYGETKPVSDNATEEGRQKNRRTEFLILGK